VAVEKLTYQKMARTTLRLEALQATFSLRVDIFYPLNFGCFEKNRVFQHPQAISPIENCG
jgi:hypothetical protein